HRSQARGGTLQRGHAHAPGLASSARVPEGRPLQHVTRGASVAPMSESARQRWEYATIPLLIHNTKAILDSWGVDGWELVTVLPGPGGAEQLVAYLKRPVG